jgi:heat shock protein HtpX
MSVSLLDRTESNRRTAQRLAWWPLIPVVLVSAIVAVLSWWWLGLILLVVGVAWVLGVASKQAVAKVSAAMGGRATDAEEFPRLFNLLESLTISSGSTIPTVRALDTEAINLAAWGTPENAHLLVTTGLLNSLNRVELEGVLAEGLQRIRAHDGSVGAAAAHFLGGPLVKTAVTAAPSGLAAVAVSLGAPTRISKAMGHQREFYADLAAVDLTRYPPALGSALQKMSEANTAIPSATWGTQHLWIASPIPEAADGAAETVANRFRSHDSLSQRIELLAEL